MQRGVFKVLGVGLFRWTQFTFINLLYYFNLGTDLTLIDTLKYLVSNYEHMFA